MRSISSLVLIFAVLGCKSTEREPCPSFLCTDYVDFHGATSVPLSVLVDARITICHDATCVRAESAGIVDAGADTARDFVIPPPLGGNFVLAPAGSGKVEINGRAETRSGSVHAGDTWSFRVEVEGAAKPVIDLTLHPKYSPLTLGGDPSCSAACQSADLYDIIGCGSGDALCVPGAIERDASCAPGNAKTRVCTEACGWSDWSACGAWRPMATAPKEFRPRGVPGTIWAHDRFVVLGGFDGPTPLIDGALYDPVADAWTMLPAAPFGRLGRSLATADGTIFLTSDQGPVQLSLATDPPTWSKLPPPTVPFPTSMPEPMGSGFLPASREVMFFLCPFTTGAHDAIAYSLDKGTWRELPSLGKARDTCDAYAVEGSVAFTGVKGALSIFDGAIDGWRSSSLPVDTVGLSRGAPLFAVAFGETIASRAYRFDLSSLAWSPLPLPPFELGGQSVAASAIGTNAGRLIIWGTNHRPVGAVFDPVASRWSRLPDDGPTARTHMQTLWTGKETIVWGGDLLLTSLVDGKRLILE